MQTYIYKTADGYEVRCDEPKLAIATETHPTAMIVKGIADITLDAVKASAPPKPFAYLLVSERGRIVSSTKDKAMADAWQSLSEPGDRIVPVYENA
jgi:hypothetical protein